MLVLTVIILGIAIPLTVFILIRTVAEPTAEAPEKKTVATATEEQKETFESFDIPKYISPVDFDGDGIDDQTDILESVRAYANTYPEYKSAYYSGGYPNDGYGVCTDVVAQGLLSAGYNLRDLVDADIRGKLSEYGIDKPDSNIDFRRVKNLKIYFHRTATALTNNIHDISEWQGGDIVISETHIGVVSDRRNKNGVSYIFHHQYSGQKYLEQDVLETYGEVIGHYRIS